MRLAVKVPSVLTKALFLIVQGSKGCPFFRHLLGIIRTYQVSVANTLQASEIVKFLAAVHALVS